MNRLTDAVLSALTHTLTGLHTGNGAEIAGAVDSLIDSRLTHLQGAVDRACDQLTALRTEMAQLQGQLQAVKEGAPGEKKART